MTKRHADDPPPGRGELEKLLSADIRAITARSERVGRHFAHMNDVSNNDFHALLHIMVAETAGTPLTLAQLRQRMDVSPPAITYLVDRMIESGHIRREPDPQDRRKWLLRYENHGMATAQAFFRPLGAHLSAAMADLTDKDLVAAHRVFTAMIAAMSTFEDELGTPGPDLSAELGRRAAAPPRRQRMARSKASRS
ncbi:MarR family winged helix-turn-helix transcriptional regulator [Mycobacterium sp.]|uniref:MarR family winged helix-turn-helix transcriptional regulator n=1 Tax=Mycobacterium sp. TaxID=1785 RepID=UPI002CDA1DB2|nr:MarR family transcriptional regulator [Mycobacterium sp.]HTQ16528.1 MarR family transcriptional regulator [Mycobacterium sp.]